MRHYGPFCGENKFAHEILAAALADEAASQQTVFLMLESFATVLANAALSFGSGAGIVVAGGIVPRMTKLLPQSDFFNRFDNHGRLSDFLRVLPIYLSVDPCAGLRGGAIAPENQNLTKKIVRI